MIGAVVPIGVHPEIVIQLHSAVAFYYRMIVMDYVEPHPINDYHILINR